MGLLKNAAHGDAANGVRELQGSGDNGALAGGHRNRFTRIPLAMKDAPDPFRGRHQPGQLLGEIDTSLTSQPQFTAVVGNAVDAFPTTAVNRGWEVRLVSLSPRS